jgi:hypothetical protein
MTRLLIFFILLPLSVTAIAKSKNKIRANIDKLDYTRPKKNNGSGGNLTFSSVQMLWSGMKLNINNHQAFLDANIRIKPKYVRLKTSGIQIGFAQEAKSFFYTIKAASLANSRFALNSSSLNFDGKRFEIELELENGTSLLVLDKFNLNCIGPKEIDMTTLEGFVHGCLHDALLNGQKNTDLAGALIEYHSETNDDMSFVLKTRLKDFELINNTFTLDLSEAKLEVEGYEISTGKTIANCKKDPKITTLDFQALKDSCNNSVKITSPQIIVKNEQEKSMYLLDLKKLTTDDKELYAHAPNIVLTGEDKSTVIKGLKIKCNRAENSEFYDLHQTVAGCVDYAKIDVDSISTTEIKEEGNIVSRLLFNNKKYTSYKTFVKGIDAEIIDNRLTMKMLVIPPIAKPFEVNLVAAIQHVPTESMIIIEIIRYKAIKWVTAKWILMKIAKLFLSEYEMIEVKNDAIYIRR